MVDGPPLLGGRPLTLSVFNKRGALSDLVLSNLSGLKSIGRRSKGTGQAGRARRYNLGAQAFPRRLPSRTAHE